MSKAKGATPRTPPNTLSFFAAMLVGVLLTLGIGLFVYLWSPFKTNDKAAAEDAPMVQPKVETASTPQYEFYDLLKQQQVSGVPDEALASQVDPTSTPPDVVVTAPPTHDGVPTSVTDLSTLNQPPSGKSTPVKPLPDDNGNVDNPLVTGQSDNSGQNRVRIEPAAAAPTYILQINSFDNADDADQRRAEVLMAGVDAQIVKRRLADGQHVHQVISRPMPTSNMAAEAQRRLQNSGIDSLIVEQRH